MEFFQQLAAAADGKLDITLRIMQKNDTLTINVMPGTGSSIMKPLLITGTPVELDAEFISQIIPQAKEIPGLITNIEEVKQDSIEKVKTKSGKEKATNPKNKEKAAPKKDKAVSTDTPLFPEEDEG